MNYDKNEVDKLRAAIKKWQEHPRHMPWRNPEQDGAFSPYKILVSEMMLQQTQVSRVVPKFNDFIAVFPTISALAKAPFADVLRLWSGLGYNRRAKYLHEAAKVLSRATSMWSEAQLVACTGIGPNTAKAIRVYSYNVPEIFIETNIRTVYIHHFFKNKALVDDKALVDVLALTLDRQNPRTFYWALMDYGTELKKSVGNLSKHSKTYKKQSTFIGSKRQVRGAVLRLLATKTVSRAELTKTINDERLDDVLTSLIGEGLVEYTNGKLKFPN